MGARIAWTGTHFAKVSARVVRKDTFVDALAAGFGTHISRVLAGRMSSLDALTPRISELTHPRGLPDIDIACERLARAIERGEKIAIVTDHDVDGVTSHAVILSALLILGHRNTFSCIGNRLRDGYGLSDGVADRLLPERPAVVITADCGSADEPRIARLKDAGIDVIVTDHHEIPADGPPQSALAVVSPARDDSSYEDRYIAGCMVSWLLMCRLRSRLIQSGAAPKDTPSFSCLLDFVGLGTVADCVTLADSHNNRAVVRAALNMVGGSIRPCWVVARRRGWISDPPSALDFGFQVGPRINARGRLDDAMAGVQFLMAESVEQADAVADLLEAENKTRREIEKKLTENAIAEADRLLTENNGMAGLPVWLPDGHPGVHGIVASRLVERFGAPVACLSPHAQDDNAITGSVRGVDGVDIKKALDDTAATIGGLMLKHGGHKGAGGFTIAADGLDAFRLAFNEAVQQQMAVPPGPRLETDGESNISSMPDVIREMQRLEPFGRGFEPPVFEYRVRINAFREIGGGEHLALSVSDAEGAGCRCVWFRAPMASMPLPLKAGMKATVIGTPGVNRYNGNTSLQIVVKGVVL